MRIDPLVQQRLRWVGSMFDSIHRAIDALQGEPKIEVNPSDPLHAILRVGLSEALDKKTRAPLRYYIRAWADLNDVEVKRVVLEDDRIEIEVFIKYRGGGECNHTVWKPGPRPIRRGGSAGSSTSRRRRRRR